jgi:hypothetical protein
MQQYHSPTATATNRSTRPVRPINGRGLKHLKLDVYQRANLAAHCVSGVAPLQPSIEQARFLFDVPWSLLSKHLRARNGNGSNGKRKPRPTSESLAEHILRVTPAERLAAARIIGVDTVWDEMIAPVIAAEQAAE